MSYKLRISACVIVSILLTATCEGSNRHNSNSGFGDIVPTHDVVWVGVGVAAIGAGIGIGVYYGVHHSHTLTGCASEADGVLGLMTDGDKDAYQLTGNTNGIKPGDRVRISGKKGKDANGAHAFHVQQLSKDLGPCHVQQ